MNKRIKELMKQSETECGFDPNKFAELIVRECADWMSSARTESGDRIGDSFYWASKMEQHFFEMSNT